ncbi:MAG: tat pathway signal sequence [Segniliparus sp.]|uniref:tat pathway signal sequence n=1 Tax=Segniliparus sp. TaxID=2804064 RepID=UPI003F2F6BCB
MPCLARAVALTAVLSPLFAPGIAEADPNPDCAVLQQAAGSYSKLASHFASLRKVAEQPGQHAEATRELADQARSMGDTLRDLSGKLTSQDLKSLYWEDALSFDDYADALTNNINSGDASAVKDAHARNVKAVNAANDAFYAACKR